MQQREIPLLEYDENKTVKFSPADYGKKEVLPEKCVILYCGDDLSSEKYDTREFFKQDEIRSNLTEWALACVKNF